MKKLFQAANEYIRRCDWKDLAMIKLCKPEAERDEISLLERIRRLEKGMSQNEIAEFFHTTQKVIHNMFKRNGYTCRKAFKRNQFGCNNSSWVGNKAKYATLHKRVEALKGKPQYCEVCGTSNPSTKYEWANVTGNYYDIENGYKRMCAKCHRAFDRSEKGVRNYVER